MTGRTLPLVAAMLACAAEPVPAGPAPDPLDDPSLWPGQDQRGERPLGTPWDMPAAGAGAFTLLSANVGNVDVFRCAGAVYKLCSAASERRIAHRIAVLHPDVLLLQETLPPRVCDSLGPVEEWHVCHPSNTAAEPEQVRRLVGPDYTVACDARGGYECVAVRRGFAPLEGCADGALCRGGARTGPPVEGGCDTGFVVVAATATIAGRRTDLVSAHPPSGFSEESQNCRRAHLDQLFGDPSPIRSADRAIAGGDWNMDPFRSAGADVERWHASVSARRDSALPFALHSGLVEHDPPYWSAPLVKLTWDHVVSEGFIGRCVTLGAAPGLAPLDYAEGDELQRLDHLAQWCTISAR